ncbi:hypothetical protein OIU77_019899 [Salix suchowensis]|uniref:Uncharacterized protein n=1 Tax=Salix suchowensis TaxID=1278906 RepID=A0ABQ9CM83_9ROSI|nr:hypothetical protein OIU77_019899 [Salix suchowensis]
MDLYNQMHMPVSKLGLDNSSIWQRKSSCLSMDEQVGNRSSLQGLSMFHPLIKPQYLQEQQLHCLWFLEPEGPMSFARNLLSCNGDQATSPKQSSSIGILLISGTWKSGKEVSLSFEYR